MPATPVTLRLTRLDGTELTIENADRLADLFFALDRSSRGDNAYDAMTSRTSPTRIERVDVDAIDGPMRARSRPEVWQDLFDMPVLPWLAALDPAWDLMLDDANWDADRIPEALIKALARRDPKAPNGAPCDPGSAGRHRHPPDNHADPGWPSLDDAPGLGTRSAHRSRCALARRGHLIVLMAGGDRRPGRPTSP